MTESIARVLNFPGLEAKLKEMALAEEFLVNAALAGALPIQNEAKRRAPKRTRNLSRSIHTEVKERARYRVKVAVGTDVEYAAIHEFGGTIKPKNAKFLAIPQTDAARAAAGGPRAFPGKLHPVISKDGQRGVLLDESDVVQYALTKSVTIPARPYMRPALDTKADAAVRAVRAAIVKQLEAAGKK